jgi:hypothetical protein
VLPKLKPFNTGEDPLHLEDYFQLVCSIIHGDSPFTFEWLFKNKTIMGTEERRIDITKKSSTLSIDSVLAKHSGEYTCKVVNKAGFSTITTELVVEGLFSSNSLFIILVFFPPSYIQYPHI